MPTVREQVLQHFRQGRISLESPLTDVIGIGPYIEGRMRRALNRATALTVGEFVRVMSRRSTPYVLRTLYDVLQNERANQCVSPRTRGNSTKYHAQDINNFGYEALVAVLDHARPNVRYGPLPRRHRSRSPGSKTCGCYSTSECSTHNACALSDNGSQCVPRAARSNGFVGSRSDIDQRESVHNQSRVRSASRVRHTNALRRDPDSMSDVAAEHTSNLNYSRRRQQLWRTPGPRVRHPIRRNHVF